MAIFRLGDWGENALRKYVEIERKLDADIRGK